MGNSEEKEGERLENLGVVGEARKQEGREFEDKDLEGMSLGEGT